MPSTDTVSGVDFVHRIQTEYPVFISSEFPFVVASRFTIMPK